MFVRRVLILAAALGGGWWLFADTYARYAPVSVRDCEEPGRPSLLRFAHFGTYHDYRLWETVIADFEGGHSHIRVRQEYVVGLAGAYDTKMRQQILSHTLPDVALVQLGRFHELADHFADLSELVEEACDGRRPLATVLDAGALAAFQIGGRQRGLPVSGGSLLIFGNTECFERASRLRGRSIPLPGNDWTMKEFRATAELLTCDFDGDGRIDQFGFWLPRWVYYLPWIWSFGAELTDEALTRWTLVGPEAEEAFGFYHNLAVGDRVCPRGDEVPQLFQDVGFLTGKVAMCVNGPWFLPFLAKTRLADSYFVAPIPKGKAGRTTRITWDGVVMSKDLSAGRRARAWEFVNFVLSKPVQDRIARAGRALPARVESTGAFVGPAGDARRLRFVEALSYSRLQPALPRFGEIDRAINRFLVHLVDPNRGLGAGEMLDILANDPAILSAFSDTEPPAR